MKKVISILLIALALTIANTAAALDISVKPKPNLSVFQALSAGQTAKDQNSYTKKLIEGFSGKADLNKDGQVSLQELSLFFEIDALDVNSTLIEQTPVSFIETNFALFKSNEKKQSVLATGSTELVNIAIDKYQSPQINPLQNAVEDAKQMQKVLTDMDQEGKLKITSLVNEKATRNAILEALNNAVNNTKNETIIVYITGQSDSDLFAPYEIDLANPFLSGIQTETFVGVLKRADAKVLIISDTCLLWESSMSRSYNGILSTVRKASR